MTNLRDIGSRLAGYWIRVLAYDSVQQVITFERAMAPDQAGHSFTARLADLVQWEDLYAWAYSAPYVGQLAWIWFLEDAAGAPAYGSCGVTGHNDRLGGPDRWMSSRGFYAYYGTVQDVTGAQVLVDIPGDSHTPIMIPDWHDPYYVWPHHPYVLSLPHINDSGWILFGPGMESDFDNWSAGYKYPQNAGGPARAGIYDITITSIGGNQPSPAGPNGHAYAGCRYRGKIWDPAAKRYLERTTASGKKTPFHPLPLMNGVLIRDLAGPGKAPHSFSGVLTVLAANTPFVHRKYQGVQITQRMINDLGLS